MFIKVVSTGGITGLNERLPAKQSICRGRRKFNWILLAQAPSAARQDSEAAGGESESGSAAPGFLLDLELK
jgi:hypothetical protein